MDRRWLGAALAVAVLSACGGGSPAPQRGATTTPPPQAAPPVSPISQVERLSRTRRHVDSVYSRLDSPRARIKAKLSDRLLRVDARADVLLHRTEAAALANGAEVRRAWVEFLSARNVAVEEVNGLPRVTSLALAGFESRIDSTLDELELDLARIESKLK